MDAIVVSSMIGCAIGMFLGCGVYSWLYNWTRPHKTLKDVVEERKWSEQQAKKDDDTVAKRLLKF